MSKCLKFNSCRKRTKNFWRRQRSPPLAIVVAKQDKIWKSISSCTLAVSEEAEEISNIALWSAVTATMSLEDDATGSTDGKLQPGRFRLGVQGNVFSRIWVTREVGWGEPPPLEVLLLSCDKAAAPRCSVGDWRLDDRFPAVLPTETAGRLQSVAKMPFLSTHTPAISAGPVSQDI